MHVLNGLMFYELLLDIPEMAMSERSSYTYNIQCGMGMSEGRFLYLIFLALNVYFY